MRQIFLTLLLILILIGCAEESKIKYQPVNPNASKETISLLNYFYSISGKNILSGQHNYPHQRLESTDSVIAITGKTPAIWGCDFIAPQNGQKNTQQDVVDEAIRQHKKGSIITLMYHQVKPFDADSLGFVRSVKGRVTDEEWNQIITPGTDYNKMLIEKIDNVAGYLKQLKEMNIPVLWRPYHEMNGMWFWYGDRKGSEGFVKLWKIMFERYVNYHKLDNLIWVWNANGPRDWKDDWADAYHHYYPGNDYVDILAADIYKNDYKKSHQDQLIQLGKGKAIAIGECGILPTPKILKEQTNWVWFMDWANFIWKHNAPDDVRELYNYKKIITLEGLQ